MSVGFIGPLKACQRVTVYNRTPATAEPLII
jgi:hypothetical protein